MFRARGRSVLSTAPEVLDEASFTIEVRPSLPCRRNRSCRITTLWRSYWHGAGNCAGFQWCCRCQRQGYSPQFGQWTGSLSEDQLERSLRIPERSGWRELCGAGGGRWFSEERANGHQTRRQPEIPRGLYSQSRLYPGDGIGQCQCRPSGYLQYTTGRCHQRQENDQHAVEWPQLYRPDGTAGRRCPGGLGSGGERPPRLRERELRADVSERATRVGQFVSGEWRRCRGKREQWRFDRSNAGFDSGISTAD